MKERVCQAPYLVHESQRRARTQERTVKNEFELVLDQMIRSWFRWYWLALASALLLGAEL